MEKSKNTITNNSGFGISIIIILSGVLGFAAQVTYLNIFKASYGMGLFYTIFSISSVLSGIAPILITATIIPYLSKFRYMEREKKKVASESLIILLIGATIVFLIGLSCTIWYINTEIVRIEARELAKQLAFLLWASSCIQLLSQHFGALLQSESRFYIVSLSAILAPILGILFSYLFGNDYGVLSIGYAYLLASLLQVITLSCASRHWISLTNVSFSEYSWILPTLRSVSQIILSLLPFTIITPCAFYWANPLPEGAAASFGFNVSITAFVSVVVSMGISTLLLPKYSNSARSDEPDFIGKMIKDVYSKINLVLMIAIMIGSGLSLVSNDLIKVIFINSGGGERSVQNLIPWLMLSAVAISGLNVLRSFLYAIGEVRIFALVGIISIILFNAICWFLGGYYGIRGIGLTYSFTYFIFFATCLVYLGIKYPVESIVSIVREAITSLFSALVAVSIVYSTSNIWGSSFNIINIIIILFFYFIIFYLINRYAFESLVLKSLQNEILRRF